MSIISLVRPTAACPQNPICAPTALTAPSSEASPPTDSLDFSKIDSPLKAVLLPQHEPATLIAVGAGVLFSVVGSMGGSIPQVAIDVASKSAGQSSEVHYKFDMLAQSGQLQGTGQVGGHPFHDSISRDVNQKGATFDGSVGDSATHLTLGVDQDAANPNGFFVIQGNLGEVAHDLKYIATNADGKGSAARLRTEGTIGNQPYTAELTFDGGMEKIMNLEGGSARATFRGQLGDAEIAKDYTIEQHNEGDNSTLTIKGSGTTAGVAQEITATVKLTK